MGNFQPDTYRAPDYASQKRDPENLPTIGYFEDVERRGNSIIAIYNQKRHQYAESTLVRCCKEAIRKHEEHKSIPMAQKDVRDSLQPADDREALLRKRSYNHAHNLKNFGTGSGRNLDNLVFSTTYLQTY